LGYIQFPIKQSFSLTFKFNLMFNQTEFAASLAANLKAAAASKSTEMTVMISGVSDWKPTATGLAVKMVRTTEHGAFWPLAANIKNLPASFSKPIAAKATLTEAKTPNADGTKRYNMTQLEFEGLKADTLNAIRAMPAGTALFASANGFN
jgi:hypothetical protein